MKPPSKILLFCFLIFLIGCLKPDQFSKIPDITFKEFVQESNTQFSLVIDFTDGDGNIGLNPRDTIDPFVGRYYYNIFIEFYKKENGTWVQPSLPFPEIYYGRIPFVESQGQNNSLKGEIRYKIDYSNLLAASGDTVRFEVGIVDRLQNESNTITTRELIKP